MKLPKETKRHCPYCNKHTVQTIATAKQKSRSATHPLSRGSNPRMYKRGLRVGFGNQGKYSRKAPKDWKRKSKITKRISIVFKCKECGKMKGMSKAIRTSRIEVGDKVSK
jgi:large subunit ribosomal protein L44e